MKPNNTNIAHFFGLTRQTIGTYKKDKPRIYEALKMYFMQEKDNQIIKGIKMKEFKISILGVCLEYFKMEGFKGKFFTTRGNNFRAFCYKNIIFTIPMPRLHSKEQLEQILN